MKITDKMFEDMVKIAKLYNVYCCHIDHWRFKESKVADLKLGKACLQLQKHYHWSNNKLENFFGIAAKVTYQAHRNTSGDPFDKNIKECEEYLDSLTKEDIPFTEF